MEATGLRLHLQALLLARSAVLDRRSEGYESARRLASALALHPLAPIDLRRAAAMLERAPDVDVHLEIDELLRELRRGTGSARGSGSVLLVDKDPMMRSMLSLVVRPYARKVHPSSTLAEARRVLEESRPSAIVLDLNHPDGDGRDLLRELQLDATLESVPILVLTAEDDPLVRAECLALGAREVHSKPLDPVVLTHAISVLLGFEERTNLEFAGDFTTGMLGPAEIEERALELRERFFATGQTWTVLALSDDTDELARIADLVREVVGLPMVACREGNSVVVVLDKCMDEAVEIGQALRRHCATALHVGGTECANSTWTEVSTIARRMLLLARGSEEVVVVPATSLDRVRPRVVVVDRDPAVAQQVTAALGADREVVALRDGTRLFSALDTMRATAVILDVHAGNSNGLDLLRQVRSSVRHARTPVVLVSEYDLPRQIEEGLLAGADDYVTKPFHPVTLRARLDHVIERRRA